MYDFKIGMVLVKRAGVPSTGSYAPRVRIVGYDPAYRRWQLDCETEMTSVSLDTVYTTEEQPGAFL